MTFLLHQELAANMPGFVYTEASIDFAQKFGEISIAASLRLCRTCLCPLRSNPGFQRIFPAPP
jgi:hypothetical protein